jgi:predicted O-methyltransferase YrrM
MLAQPHVGWGAEGECVIGDTVLVLDWGPEATGFRGAADRFVLQKTPEMIRYYASLADRGISRVLEAGVFRGGSVVLLLGLLRPERLVAFDLSPDRLPDLDEFIAGNHLEERVHVHFGIDQQDRAALSSLLDAEFGGDPLDLVIDDASHKLGETRATFNTLYPALRPGGVYVVEDWGWAHWRGIWQDDPGEWAARPSLTQLVQQLVMASASCPEAVANVLVRRDLVAVTRGPAVLGADFDIERCCLTAGRRFIELLADQRALLTAARPALLNRASWVWRHEGPRGVGKRILRRLGVGR